MKKGQIEIVGLLVIVILVSIVIFFALSFRLNQDETQTPVKEEFKDTQAISNFASTILETSTSCNRVVRDMILDCVYTKEIVCGGKNSCEIANDTMEYILTHTMDEWGYRYSLSVKGPNNFVTMFNETDCSPTVTSSSEVQGIGSAKYGTNIYMKIRICSN